MTRGARVITVLLSGLMLLGGGFMAIAQDTKAQENKKAKLENEIRIIDRQLRDVSSRSASATSKLTLLRKQISNRKALIQESDKDIRSLNRQITEKNREVAIIQGRLDTLSVHYTRLVRSAYKNRDSRVWYMYVLASDNVSQAFRRIGYLKNMSSQMDVQARKIREAKAKLEEETAKLTELRDQARELRRKRQEEMNSLQKEETQSDKIVRDLQRQKSQYQKELAAKRKQVEALNREIERIIREATRGTSTGKGGKSKTVVDEALNAQFAQNKGKLPWPADGPVVDKFGQHYHPVYKNVKLPFNNGIGIALAPGTKVQAVFDGVVKQIVVMPGYNQCVLVQHGNYFSFYCKLSSVNVKSGDKVKTGQVIGTVDTIAGETQLHFQIWNKTTPQNPELWLK